MATVIEMRFYVYEHWRPDLGVCFYVGKGQGKRAYDFSRSNHYNHVARKLDRLGMEIEVRIVRDNLSETQALSMEIERIAYWRSRGDTLTNITDGGEGVSGMKHSDESRAKIREKRALQKIVCSPETRNRIRLAQKGIPKPPDRVAQHASIMRGRTLSAEHKQKISLGLTGGIRSDEARANMSKAQRGHPTSELARINLSIAHMGNAASAATREKMSATHKERWRKIRESRGMS